MKQITQSLKAQLITLVLLCVSMTAMANENGVLIDGVYYNLQNSWYYYYYDANGNYQNSQYVNNAAIVTYNPDTEVNNPGSVETYSGDIQIPATVTYNGTEYSVVCVDNYAFANCRSLTSVQLPSSILEIRNYAFRYCTGLISVSMPGVEKINYQIFANSAVTSVLLPESLKYIESEAFNYSELTSITVDADNAAFTSVDGVLYDKNVTTIAAFPRRKSGTYTIPATVTTIKQSSFPNDVVLDELIIPATVAKIESYAFRNYPQIKKLTIEDSENELIIGQGNNYYSSLSDEFGNNQDVRPMFRYIEELYWGRNLKFSSTYSSPFAGSNLSKIVFGANVTAIPQYTFYRSNSVNSINVKGGFAQWCGFDFSDNNKYYRSPCGGFDQAISNGGTYELLFNGVALKGDFAIPTVVTEIPSHALQYGCSTVTSLTIHAGVTAIADGAFKGLSSLNTVALEAGNTHFTLADNVLYNKEKTKILLFPQLRSGDYAMPATITELGDYQFYNCVNLTGITLPSTIKAIALYAFANCSKLEAITIPASVETIYDYAFDGCSALTKVVLEDGENDLTIGRGGKFAGDFYYGSNWYSFYPLFPQSLKELYLGRNLIYTSITGSPFAFSALKKVEIGSKVTTIPEYTFCNTYGINEVNYDGTITEWCNITFADQYATPFGQSSSAILSLKEGTLQNQVVIPEGATKIGAYAFYGQNGVLNVTIPSTMTTIEPYALQGFSDVYINATHVIGLDNANSFSDFANIYVPDVVTTNYKNAAVWSGIKDRIYPKGFLDVTVNLIAMGTSPALLPALNALAVTDGEYKITALTNLKIVGTMNGYDILMIRTKMPNLRHLDLTEAEIVDNDGGKEYYQGYHTTKNTISAYSFYNLTNLRSITLPQNITSIDYRAFYGCSNLKEVKFMPSTCTSIGSEAFANSGLTSIEIGEGVKTIGNYAFSNCNNLSELILCRGLEEIGGGAFSYCQNLRKLELPTTLKRINSEAFYHCYSLSEIDFAEGEGEEGLTDIGYGAFQYCSSLQDLHMPTTLKRIESYAFNGCSNLNVVHVPSMLESIGDYAFTGCGLRGVYAYTVVPIPINQNTFDYRGVDLYAPDNSFYAYYLDTQWSQFQDVTEFPANYSEWYTPRNTDYHLSITKPLKGTDIKGYLYPGSGLIITGIGEQLMKKLVLKWNHGSNYPSLVENGNLNIDELTFIMNMYPRRWYFFCFPCDVKIQDLKFDGNGQYVWRYYDPLKRREGLSGWTNVTGDVLKAGVGYIYQCSKEGTIEIPAYNPDYLVRNNTGTGSDKNVDLISTAADNPQDASWNFVGNPNLSYYSLDDLSEDFTAPITVWNDENQTYDAVVPGDDDYDIHPFQAFFIQKPNNAESVTFRAENRLTYNQSQEKATARRMARAARAVDENHLIVNVEISDGTTTDKTRVVFDDSKSMSYEIGTDANKLMSMAEVPQIYTLDNKDVKYALNTRPNNNNEVRLGIVAPSSGTYTIKAPRMDICMALKDNATGMIHEFSKGDYTFLAEAGTTEDRFSLVRSGGLTGISEAGIEGLDISVENGVVSINGITDQPVSVYSVKGIRVATLSTSGNVNLASGTYIVSAGDKASKIIVR